MCFLPLTHSLRQASHLARLQFIQTDVDLWDSTASSDEYRVIMIVVHFVVGQRYGVA